MSAVSGMETLRNPYIAAGAAALALGAGALLHANRAEAAPNIGPILAAASQPSSVSMTAECADFNGDGTPEVQSTFHFSDTQNRIALDRSGQTVITWDIVWKGIRNSDPDNPNSTDRVTDFGNITDLVRPYDPVVVAATPEYVDGVQQYDAVITHTMPKPNDADVVNSDGSFTVVNSLRSYVSDGEITTSSTTVDCTPNPTPVVPSTNTGNPDNNTPPPDVCSPLAPDLKLKLQHLGKKSNRWLLNVTASATGQGVISAKGNSADKNPKKAKNAAGFTFRSSVPVKVPEKKTQHQVGKTARIDLLKNISEAKAVKFSVPFTTKNPRALPKISILFNAPKGTVLGTCNGTQTLRSLAKPVSK